MWISPAGTILTDEQFDIRFQGNNMEAVMVGGWQHVENVEGFWQEYDCPVSGIDFDLDPPVPLGTRFSCSGCGGHHIAGEDVTLQLLPMDRLPRHPNDLSP